MEALAKLEKERGNPGYQSEEQEDGGTGMRHGNEKKKEISPVSIPRKASIPRGASDEMCTFLVLNISSLQLIPVSIIAYRSQYGSFNPAAVIGPGLLATAISTAVAVLFCKVMQVPKRKLH